jgi:dinuclear metal center YbgI/SA1388 family protein
MLVESPRASNLKSLRVITCIDLTNDVVTEAINKNCNLILSYHPVMFRAIQCLSMSTQRPLLRCIDSGISVFVPHTAVDTAQGGMNDFLCDIFHVHESERSGVRDDPDTGISVGRIVSLKEPLCLNSVISLLKSSLGLERVRFATQNDPATLCISSVAVCVGSGSSVLVGAKADLYLTGEMTHHDILACQALGKSVILLDHSSSERPFLPELARRVAQFECVESVVVSEMDVEPIRSA